MIHIYVDCQLGIITKNNHVVMHIGYGDIIQFLKSVNLYFRGN